MDPSKANAQEISLRIKYESLAKLTAEMNTAQSLDVLADVLRTHLKYLFNLTHFRLLVFYKSQQLQFHIDRKTASFANTIDKIYPIEEDTLKRNVPVIFKGQSLTDSLEKFHPEVTAQEFKEVYLYPVRSSDEQYILVCGASQHDNSILDDDYRFLRLTGEFLLSKLSQLILTEQLEDMVTKRTGQLNNVNRELATLFYKSSHDLTSPLTSLRGLLQLSRLHITNPTELEILFTHIDNVIGPAQAMLNKLKTISELDAMAQLKHEMDLQAFTLSIITKHQTVAKKRGINLSHEVLGHNLILFSEPMLIFLLNSLIENAIQYHRFSGDSYVRVILHAKPGILFCSVEDNGAGIEASLQAKIFDMYMRGTENSKGNGLGLYMVKKILEKLNGSVTLISQPGKGSCFTLSIPLSA